MSPDHRERIVPVTRMMTHRGPDDEGYYHDASISLGQRRLSIIDLDGGRQPIANEDETLQLVCNGEIYNSPALRSELQGRGHRFRTATDVEVILHLYEEEGPEAVKRLRGMFGLAIWDRKRRALFLARDPLGQKPLFYAREGGRFAFASEVKSVLASGVLPIEPDIDALWHYMSLRFLPDRRSLFKGVCKLPAATWLLLEQEKMRCERYWTLDFREKLEGDERSLVDRLDAKLHETIEAHLLSDVPVGTFLSGGIDSSLVTAIMARISGRSFPTFSIGVREQSFNELPFARMVSERYGLEAHAEVVEADLVHRLPEMIHHMDEPSDPYGVGVYLVSRLAARHVKVVLGGDGGDENFAGYDRYGGQSLVDWISWMPAAFRRHVLARLVRLVPESFQYKSLAQKLAWLNDMSFYSHGERYARSMSFLRFTDEHKQSLFTPEARAGLEDADSNAKILEHFEAETVDELVDRMLNTDLMTRMPDHLLVIGDRMSMAHSLESRPPMMDAELCALAAALPCNLKLRGRRLKYILRRVAERYLPRELIERPKQGFGFPIGIWLRTDLRVFTDNLLRESRFVERGLFNPTAMRRLFDEHVSGSADHNYRLWILINLELWHRLYFEGETPDSLREVIDRAMVTPV